MQRLNQALTCAVGLLAMIAGSAAAQDAPKTESVSMTLDEAMDRTVAMLDRFDARVGEKPSREELEELNSYIIAIQKQEPDNPRVNYLYGRAWALMGGKTGRAIDQLEKFTETRDGRLEWKAFRTLGDLYVAEYPNLAKGKYERADKLKPKEPSVLYGLSRAHFELGAGGKALELAQQAVAEDKATHVTYVAHLARMLFVNQQWVEADRTTVTAIELAGKEVAASPGRPGPLLVLQEQLDAMINLLRTRAQLPGATPEEFVRLARYTVDRAEAAHKLAQYDALVVLESALRQFPQPSAAILEQYGILLATVGRNDSAIEAFQKLHALDADNAAAKEWLDRLKAPAAAAASNPGPE